MKLGRCFLRFPNGQEPPRIEAQFRNRGKRIKYRYATPYRLQVHSYSSRISYVGGQSPSPGLTGVARLLTRGEALSVRYLSTPCAYRLVETEAPCRGIVHVRSRPPYNLRYPACIMPFPGAGCLGSKPVWEDKKVMQACFHTSSSVRRAILAAAFTRTVKAARWMKLPPSSQFGLV